MESRNKGRSRRAVFVLAAVGIGLGGGVVSLGAGTGGASSHREAPMTAGDPRIDNTDLYAFVSPERPDTVTLMANFIPFQEPVGGPDFYTFATDAKYKVNIDNDGDAKPDLTYTWSFRDDDKRGNATFLSNNGPVTSLDDENLLYKQRYTLTETGGGKTRTLIKDAVAAPSNAGPASMPDYASLRSGAVQKTAGGATAYAGQSEDPFFLDLRVFDLLYGADLKETGQDTLAGYNVNTLALQIPKKALALKGSAERNPVVGVWSTVERGGTQVSRLGNPLVNEVVLPAKLKDAFNGLKPHQDHTVKPAVDRVLDPEVPKLIEKIYGVQAPAAPRKDLAEIFLTGIAKANGPIKADLNSQILNKDVNAKEFTPAEVLRLNMGVAPSAKANRLGVIGGDLQGFPNGRRLTDDVVDIGLQALEGAAQTGKIVDALAAGDRVDTNDKAFGTTFPYVAVPNGTAVNARS